VSNLETRPEEVACPAAVGVADPASPVQIVESRLVPLGGPRAMTVRRTLPHKSRSTIGAWCFADHYGPEPVSATGGMVVPPHPHTGLQTVSWLFQGGVEHRDSTGAHAVIRPGQINLMTAGRGVQHSEYSTADTDVLHGVQLWTVLPEVSRAVAPFFEASEAQPFALGPATARVFVGSLHGREHADAQTEVTLFSPLLGAQLDLPAGAELELELDPAFEHGVLVDAGPLEVDGLPVRPADLAYLPLGRERVTLQAPRGADARAVLLGGTPLGERIIMFWNFIGRTHEEVAEARERWQAEVVEGGEPDGLFGSLPDPAHRPLPSPALPLGRLKPRD